MSLNLKKSGETKLPKPGSAKRKKRIIKWTAIAVAAALLAALILPMFFRGGSRQVDLGRSTVSASMGEIKSTISSSGIIEPIERYDIVPMAKGKILSAPFEEGDTVRKDDVLYQFDAREITINMERTRNSIDKLDIGDRTTNESIRDQVVTAPQDGKIIGLTVKAGDTLPATGGKVCEIRNQDSIKVKIPFTAAQVANISVGQSATLVSAEYMAQFDGTVTHVSGGSEVSADGAVMYDVEITAANPGALTSGSKVIGIVHTPYGDAESPLPGTIDFESVSEVTAEVGGDVSEVLVKDGDQVTKGQVILRLHNESLYTTQDKSRLDKKDLALSLETQEKQLEDYSIKSPIDGVVITKNAKAGDNIAAGTTSPNILMTVADMSKMIFYIDVDELDISRVQLGQRVDVTADALPGQQFEGTITQIASEGVAENGVTTYQAKVTIDQPGELRPGMNTNAEIVVEQRENVLTVPVAAVKKIGNRSVVYVPENEATKEEKKEQKQSEKIQGQTANSAPEGTVEKEVVTGLADNNNIEIVSGLSEGDEVVIVINASSAFNPMMMGMSMGDAPGGAGGGGRPPQAAGGGSSSRSQGR